MIKDYCFIDEFTNKIEFSERPIRKRKGLLLRREEILLLQQVYTLSVLSSKSIHELYVSNLSSSAKGITNRLTRLVYAKVLRRKTETSVYLNGFKMYYYSLGSVGKEVLIMAGLVSKDAVIKNYLNKPSIHNQLASEWAINLFVEFKDKYNGLSCTKGYYHRFIREFKNIEGIFLTPDYIFEYGNTIFCIEYDRNTEPGRIMADKGEKYLMLNNSLRSKGYQLVVLIIVESSDLKQGSKISKRVVTLKDCLSNVEDYAENVPTYVVMDRKANTIFQLLLDKKYPLDVSNSSKGIEQSDWLYQLHYEKVYGLNSVNWPLEELVIDKRGLAVLRNYKFKATGYLSKERLYQTVIQTAGELCSVSTYAMNRSMNKIFEQTNLYPLGSKVSPIQLLVTFPYVSIEEIENEMYGMSPLIKVEQQSLFDVDRVLGKTLFHVGEFKIENYERIEIVSPYKSKRRYIQ